jgi:hypothetical protein
MAELSGHHVVNQTQSGGDLSPSDGPASKPDNYTAEGDGVGFQSHSNEDQSQGQMSEGAVQDKSTDGGMAESSTRAESASLGDIAVSCMENRRVAESLAHPLTVTVPQDNFTTDAAISNSNLRETLKVNGVGPGVDSPYDRSASPNVADASGGSDTDVSRTDSRGPRDGHQHSRTSSVKRPASFKPVSFAKFSISKSPGPGSASKATGEKGKQSAARASLPVFLFPEANGRTTATFSPSSSSSTPVLQASRPRLVAKSTSGFRDSTPRSLTGNKAGSSAPDPSQVWNRNRRETPRKFVPNIQLYS